MRTICFGHWYSIFIMRLELLLFIMSLVNLGFAETKVYPRGCIYWEGRCYKECEVGTHAYAITASYLQPEPTCDEPEPQQDKRIYYDYSACYCDAPTVRDTIINKCVTLDKCS